MTSANVMKPIAAMADLVRVAADVIKWSKGVNGKRQSWDDVKNK